MRKKTYLKIFLIILVLVSITLITACEGFYINEIEDEQEIEIEEIVEVLEPVEGGSLKISTIAFTTLNPLFNKNETLYQIHHLIYDSLVTFDADMDIQPALAESWEITQEGYSIDFTLKQGVLWHDGQEFTSEDLIFTIDVIKSKVPNLKNRSIYQKNLELVSNVAEIEPNVVRVTFEKPYTNALESMTFPILPKHVFDAGNIEKLNQDDFLIVGTGPFKLKNYEKMRRIMLDRNDSYWKNKPYIKEIEVLIVPDHEAQLSLFENGEIDLVYSNTMDWAKHTDNTNARALHYVTQNYEFIGLNFSNTILVDKNIRTAIAQGIDRHKLINDIYFGQASIVDAPIHPNSWLYDESGFYYSYNKQLAISRLEASKYYLGEDSSSRVNEEGTPLKFRLLTHDEGIRKNKVANFIKEQFIEIGIELEIDAVEWEVFEERVFEGDFDMVLGTWKLSHIPDISFAFHSSHIRETNFINYYNEKTDDLINRYLLAVNRDQKKRKFNQLQKHIVEELPYISLYFRNGSVIIRNRVRGELQPNSYNLFNGFESLFIIN